MPDLHIPYPRLRATLLHERLRHYRAYPAVAHPPSRRLYTAATADHCDIWGDTEVGAQRGTEREGRSDISIFISFSLLHLCNLFTIILHPGKRVWKRSFLATRPSIVLMIFALFCVVINKELHVYDCQKFKMLKYWYHSPLDVRQWQDGHCSAVVCSAW